MRLPIHVMAAVAALGASAAVAAPRVTIESFAQADDLTVTITYKLSDGPAVVTLGAIDATTSAPVTDAAFTCVSGDVNRQVTSASADEIHTIVWDPAHAMAQLGTDIRNIKPVLTAWPLDDTPDYMVVDLAATSTQRVRYFTSTNALPGGLFGNLAYRTSMLVLRKVPAKGVTWMKGSSTDEQGRNPDAASGTDPEKQYSVTFDDNYYIAIFPMTQGQCYLVGDVNVGASTFCPDGRMFRPMDSVSYNTIRECAYGNNSENATYQYPNGPNPSSFLGLLNNRTGLSFDLPSDAEWEYACRAGWGDNRWGNGAVYDYSKRNSYDVRVPGRYRYNQANTAMTSVEVSSAKKDAWNYSEKVGPTNATAMVGTYAPNDWGIYDMHGNTFEWCLDWYKDDVTDLGGAVCAAGGKTYSNGAKFRVRRGGAWYLPTTYFRSACRYSDPSTSNNASNGFRVKLGAAKRVQD